MLEKVETNLSIKVDNYEIKNSNEEKLLGITIDNKLTFEKNVYKLCRKANKILHVLSRVSHYMGERKRRIIMKAFINSPFCYCPLVWMFHSRQLNNRINKIQERALRIVYKDYNSTFNKLLIKGNSVSIHNKNTQALAIELYKIVNGISPEIMKDVLQICITLDSHTKLEIYVPLIMEQKPYLTLDLKFAAKFQKILKGQNL